MPRSQWSRGNLLSAFISIIPLASYAQGIDISFCSDFNTGSFSLPDIYEVNSLGHCRDDVCGGYAYAITQGTSCWCSNFTPGTTVPNSSCDKPCPGYPYEVCGSDDGDFSYLEIGSPSGTIGGAAATSLAESSVAPNTIVETIVNTVVSNNVIVRTSVVTEPRSSFYATTTRSQTTIYSPEVVTVSGEIQTRYVTAVPTQSPPSNSATVVQETHSGLSNGAVAGLTVGVIAAVAFAGLLIFLCCCRRRKSHESSDGKLNRNTSVLSKAGLLRHGSTKAGPIIAPIGSQPPRIDTNIPQVSETPSSATSGPGGLERRDSRPLFRDQRLNPNALMIHSDYSRTSIGTLQDNQDYSRPLEVRNPDLPNR